jgi:cell fate regulator YaaT (PSP1 superfamily)
MSIDLSVVDDRPVEQAPRSLVVRFGHLRNIGEFRYDGLSRPGCGAKVVIRTRRGTEMAEVLTTTCVNGGCAASITGEQLTDYISNSGGGDYPFSTEGQVLRLATSDDYQQQSRLDAQKAEHVRACRALVAEMELPMKVVDVELLLGGEMSTFFFMSESRVDFRGLVKQLATRFHMRIQMHQVGARDEARLVADYETCGQHCCCRQFLKVLRPVNMGSAKMQKATLDPSKISGRCGRLKCCLRYEEATYEDLRKRLPRVGMRVRTADGVGVVVETSILTQLVRVRLDSDRVVAVVNEELLERDVAEMPVERPRRVEPAWEAAASDNGGHGASRQPADNRQPPPQPRQRPPRRAAAEPRPAAPPPPPKRPEERGPLAQDGTGPAAQSNVPPSRDAGGKNQPPPQGMGSLGRRRRHRGRGRGRGGDEGPTLGASDQNPPTA